MDRRSLLSGGGVLLAAQMLPKQADARARSSPVTPDDGKFMQMAIDQAKDADYPFGAVIVRDGRVLAFGRNSSKRNSDPTAHAELLALREASRRLRSWRLTGLTLVVTLEPCTMCAGALVLARVARLVFGAFDPKAGAGSSAWCSQPRSHNCRNASGRSISPRVRSPARHPSPTLRSPAG